MENVTEYNNITLGGKEVVIGGWGEYEVEKRSLRSKLNGDKYDKYYSKKYIYPQHVIDSVLGGSRHKSSYDAINKFIATLRTKESCQNDFNNVWVMPALTSTRLENFAKEDLYDIDEMQKMNLFLRDYADMMNLQVPLESLSHVSLIKERPVHISDNNSVMELEKRMVPNINTVERNLAILASNCDKMRKAVTRRKERFGFDSSSEEDMSDDDVMSDSGSSSSGSSCDINGGDEKKVNSYDNEFMKYIYGNKTDTNYDSIDPNHYRDGDVEDSAEINAEVEIDGGIEITEINDKEQDDKKIDENNSEEDNRACLIAFIIDKE